MILTVTPNPAVDMTWSIPELTPGESHRVATGRARAGGKGINVARVLHQQGRDVLALATRGGATGAEFAGDLESSGVPHLLVPVHAATRRSIALYDEAHDETSIFNEAGTSPDESEWSAFDDAVRSAMSRSACVVGSGSLPAGAPGDFYARLVTAAQTRRLPTIVDTSGGGLLAAARAGATVLKPNRDEIVAATGSDDPIAGAIHLLELGAHTVVVSLGPDGMAALTRASGDAPDDSARPSEGRRVPVRHVTARLPEPLSGNPTGAGDATVAALAASLVDGADLVDMLRLATGWSAAAVLMPLAGELSERADELCANVIVTESLLAGAALLPTTSLTTPLSTPPSTPLQTPPATPPAP